MPFAIVQTVTTAPTASGPITATLALTKPGSLILVFCGSDNTGEAVTSITDSSGNSYSQAVTTVGGTNCNNEIWVASNTNSITSLSVAYGGSTTNKIVAVREYSGIYRISPKDQSRAAQGTATAVNTGNSSVFKEDNELVVSSISLRATAPTIAVGSGYGNFSSANIVGALSIFAIEDKSSGIADGATGVAGLFTAGGTLPSWDCGVVCFKVLPTNVIQNYESAVNSGNGMSVTEKIR